MADFFGENGRVRGLLPTGLGVPTINWAHPLAKGLVACYVPQYYPSGAIKNIAIRGLGDLTTRTGGAAGHPFATGLSATPEGYGVPLGDGTSGGGVWQISGPTPTAWQLTSGQSLFFRALRTGVATNTNVVYLLGVACSSTPFNCFIIGTGSSPAAALALFYNTTSATYVGSIVPTTGAMFSAGATFASGAPGKLYVNGVNDPLAGSPPNVNITYAGTVSTYMDLANPATRPVNQTTMIAYIWMRPLNAGEHRYLSNNPYALLQWPADMVYNAVSEPAATSGTPTPDNKSIFWSPLTVGLGGAAAAERWLRQRKVQMRRLRGE